MTPDLHTLGIDHLSMNEKLSLVHAIWDNIAQSNATIPLSEAQQREILRRTAKHDSSKEATVSWDKVREEALARLKR